MSHEIRAFGVFGGWICSECSMSIQIREVRRVQELQMSIVCYILFVLLLATSLSGIFWTIDLVREQRREKTRFEREVELNRDEIDKVQGQPQRLKR
ncbi:MAG: hypothetical protein IPK32_18205 [Verrucomicrobiaceae bacterium]|nr:hypothetical protein [Verrucomicrobiaceae bacterium]